MLGRGTGTGFGGVMFGGWLWAWGSPMSKSSRHSAGSPGKGIAPSGAVRACSQPMAVAIPEAIAANAPPLSAGGAAGAPGAAGCWLAWSTARAATAGAAAAPERIPLPAILLPFFAYCSTALS